MHRYENKKLVAYHPTRERLVAGDPSVIAVHNIHTNQVEKLFELRQADGTAFQGTVKGLTVAGEVVWTTDDGVSEDRSKRGHGLYGFALSELTSGLSSHGPGVLHMTDNVGVEVAPSSLHYDPWSNVLWVSEFYAPKTGAQESFPVRGSHKHLGRTGWVAGFTLAPTGKLGGIRWQPPSAPLPTDPQHVMLLQPDHIINVGPCKYHATLVWCERHLHIVCLHVARRHHWCCHDDPDW